MNILISNFVVIIKYIIAIVLIMVIILCPAWLARQTKRDKTDSTIVRISSWLLWWTCIGWLFSLFWGSKK